MPGNWYATREHIKRLLGEESTLADDAIIDAAIESASRSVDRQLGHRDGVFIPLTETRYYRWPQDDTDSRHAQGDVLQLRDYLISLTSLTSGNGATAVASGDLFLEPSSGPPYTSIEIDRASSAATALLYASTTPQRAIAVTGSWGYGATTKTGGTVASGLASDAAATSMVCSNGALIGVGDTLLIGTEQLAVTDRAYASASLTASALTASMSDDAITASGSGLNAGEYIQIGTEEMLILAANGTALTVRRAVRGTTLAAHSAAATINVSRTLTVVRGRNGTTAATHANSTAVSIYEVPALIRDWTGAEAISYIVQSRGGWTGSIGGGEAAAETRLAGLKMLRERALAAYGRPIAWVMVGA